MDVERFARGSEAKTTAVSPLLSAVADLDVIVVADPAAAVERYDLVVIDAPLAFPDPAELRQDT